MRETPLKPRISWQNKEKKKKRKYKEIKERRKKKRKDKEKEIHAKIINEIC